MKKLWVIPVGIGAVAAGWLTAASIPDLKRYIRMHQM